MRPTDWLKPRSIAPLLCFLSLLALLTGWSSPALAGDCPGMCADGSNNCATHKVFPWLGLKWQQGNYSTITFYYPNNKTTNASCIKSFAKDKTGQMQMKDGSSVQVAMKNNMFNQSMYCAVTQTNGKWGFAPNCTTEDGKRTVACSGCQYLVPPDDKNNDFRGLEIKKQYPLVPPDKAKGTKRVHIKNQCADPAFLVMTPPTGETPIRLPNAQLWNRTAKEAGMTFMYNNPQNTTSGVRFRKTLLNGETLDMWVPDGGIAAGNFGVLLGCTDNATAGRWPSRCKSGGVPGLSSMGVGTLFEYTAGCMPNTPCNLNPSNGKYLDGADFLDLSQVSGFNIPVSIQATNGGSFQCNMTKPVWTARGDMFDCPTENNATLPSRSSLYVNPQIDKGVSMALTENGNRVACMSPEEWLQIGPDNTKKIAVGQGITTKPPTFTDWYACNGKPVEGADANPDSCTTPGCGGPQCAVGPLGTAKDYTPAGLAKGKGKPYTNYVKYLKAISSDAYAWQFNDDASTLLCKKAGGEFQIVLCPGPYAGQKPYAKQKWTFFQGECVPNPSGGTYDTLLACMKDNFDYACSPEAVSKQRQDKSWLTAKLNYCTPVPKGTGVSYDTCMANNTQVCQSTGKTPARK